MATGTLHRGRDYPRVVALGRRLGGGSPLGPESGPADESLLREVVDALWDAVKGTGYSWVGFYTKTPGTDEMILGPRRDKPACSPLAMHGICGQCWAARRSIIVDDAMRLGAGSYVACDPKDRAEVVIPLFDRCGECWGVLDADSYEAGVFDEEDVRQLTAIVEAAGISARQPQAASALKL